ncbi:P-loop containing nucleoside triphosphate hydrolase protein, partial [Gonapodya prolifera JEL478]
MSRGSSRGIRNLQGIRVAGGLLKAVGAVIPAPFRSLFPFSHFNAMQSACVDVALLSDANLVVSAPTGSGKTCVMELAILHALNSTRNSQPRGSFNPSLLDQKIVYLAPTKALVSERARDWSSRFGAASAGAGFGSGAGVVVAELTGDSEYVQVQEIQKASIIVSTPEKWDSLTRRFRDHRALFRLVRLLLLDEVHVLGEPGRGATFEAVVARMRMIDRDLNGGRVGGLRVVAMSATVPNVEDVAQWLGGAEVRVFGEEYRPVQLERFVYGYQSSSNPFMFEKILNYKLLDIIEKHSSGQAALVFCSTRKGASSAAEDVLKSARESNATFIRSDSQKSRLAATPIKDKKLKEVLVQGVAFHHAGLDSSDRKLVERLFLDGALRLICTTTTLAVGVNLPARLVVLKGTQKYVNGSYSEYSELDVMQILGRAGRPQFDDSGVAVILTTDDRKDFYESLVTGRSVVESQLHEDLVEHLNAEVCLGTINSLPRAISYLRQSFFFIRLRKNPPKYGVYATPENGVGTIDKRLVELANTNIRKLISIGLATVDPESRLLGPTEMAHVMAKYYLKAE